MALNLIRGNRWENSSSLWSVVTGFGVFTGPWGSDWYGIGFDRRVYTGLQATLFRGGQFGPNQQRQQRAQTRLVLLP